MYTREEITQNPPNRDKGTLVDQKITSPFDLDQKFSPV